MALARVTVTASRYGAACGAVLAALLLKMVFGVTDDSPFLIFFSAIIVSGWYGGWGPGLTATVLAAVTIDYFFLTPGWLVISNTPSQNLHLLLFILEGALVSWLATLMHRARLNAMTNAHEAQRYRDLLIESEAQSRLLERQRAEAVRQQQSTPAQGVNLMKEDFLAVVSHELRQPLNSILGWSQLLRRGKLDEDGRIQAVETIEQSAKAQTRLIEDLLDVSRIMSGKM